MDILIINFYLHCLIFLFQFNIVCSKVSEIFHCVFSFDIPDTTPEVSEERERKGRKYDKAQKLYGMEGIFS